MNGFIGKSRFLILLCLVKKQLGISDILMLFFFLYFVHKLLVVLVQGNIRGN